MVASQSALARWLSGYPDDAAWLLAPCSRYGGILRHNAITTRSAIIAGSLLNGLRVLNTRPEHQAAKLSQAIEDAGGCAIELPTLVIAPVPLDYWMAQLPALDTLQIAIFLSVNAVTYFFQGLKKRGLEWPAHITVLAIGSATAAKLATYHLGRCSEPTIADSEHLLELNCLQQVAQQGILLIAGENSRPLLATTLRARGALVYNLAVYQRLLPEKNTAITRAMWQDDAIDIILLFSQQAIANLFVLFETDAKAWIQSKPCVVISPRLAATAYQFGMHEVRVTTYSGLLNTLAGIKIRKLPMFHPTEDAPKSTIRKKTNTIKFISLGVVLGILATIIGWSYQQQAQDLTRLHKNLQELVTVQHNLAQELSDTQKELHNLLAKEVYLPQDWPIQKARYYLELAQITAAWTDNTQTTKTLLTQASQLLASLPNPALQPVREALATDLQQTTANFDTNTLISRLENLSEEIQALQNPLPLLSPAGESGSLRDKLSQALKHLQTLIVVHHYPATILPTYGLILQDSILFNIQQAERAIMGHQTSAYQHALHKIASALQQNFNPEEARVKALLLEVQKLCNIPDVRPTIITALPLINAVLVEARPPTADTP